MKDLLLFFTFTLTFHAWGHETEEHSKEVQKSTVVTLNDEIKEKYIRINQEYVKRIKPIFKKSYFEDLGAINKSIKDGSMPLFLYQSMLGYKKLTKDKVAS